MVWIDREESECSLNFTAANIKKDDLSRNKVEGLIIKLTLAIDRLALSKGNPTSLINYA